jgi:hypothetical protein
MNANDRYQLLLSQVNANDAASMSRFGGYLTCVSLLVTAWATVFAADASPAIRMIVLIVVSAAGVLLSLVHAGVSLRTRRLNDFLVDEGVRVGGNGCIFAVLRSSSNGWLLPRRPQGEAGGQRSESLTLPFFDETAERCATLCGTYQLTVYSSLGFCGLFYLLLLMSIVQFFFQVPASDPVKAMIVF